MANEIKIAAESRTEFGKGAARRIRRESKVPAVIYGHGTDPIHITLPGHETLLALRTANALLSIAIDGGAEQLALPKQVQRDPIRGFVEHVDLVIVRRGEKVIVQVPVVLVGTDKDDQIINLDSNTITLESESTQIPAHIEIDITELQVGDQVLAKQLTLPEGSTYAGGDGDDLILAVSQAKSTEELEAELDAAVADATDEDAEAGDEADEAAEDEGDADAEGKDEE